MEKFYLEEPNIERKKEAIEYINEFYKYNSNINGTGSLHRYLDNYENWLIKLEEDSKRIPSEEAVPAKTYFLIRKSDNKIVGMTNIRFALNEELKIHGGHIGYSIRPTERRKGYNKINLYLALMKCQEYKIKEVLMTCDKTNIASAKTMQALGATLIKEHYDNSLKETFQYYKIDVNKAIKTYKEIYNIHIMRRE